MTVALAEAIVALFVAYLGVGAVFALAFVARGAARIDPAAVQLPMSVRLLILPGATALWPVLLVKWLRRRTPPIT